jgi:hypothetical protein
MTRLTILCALGPILTAASGLGVVGHAAGSAGAEQIAGMIRSARPGDTVTLPAGTFELGDVTVPPQVRIKGAGYAKTILDATRFHWGLQVLDNKDVQVSDLTIRNARGVGLRVARSSGVILRRVRSLGNSVGVLFDHALDSRLENAVVAENRTGLVMLGSDRSVFVNCTAAHNGELSASLTGNRGCAVFNNLFVGSQTGIYCGKDNRDLALDYNCYVAFFTGSLAGEPGRKSLPAWRDLSGYDRHSVSLAVTFADARGGDFRPATPLPWAPVRSTASGWGVKELAGFPAPSADVTGAGRPARPGLGAYEVSFLAPRPADGKFTVQAGEGVTSAGLYTADGKKVVSLFNNLPLAKGTHEFWLPGGSKLPAGRYELRLAESDLRMGYVAFLGGTGTNGTLDAPSIDPALVIFDDQDRPVLFQGGNEDHTHVRSFDPEFRRGRWWVTGEGGALGAAADGKGHLFYLKAGGKEGVYLYKVDADTGKGLGIAGDSFRKTIAGVFSDQVSGMTVLDGALYVADTGKNKVYYTDAKELTFAKGFDVPAPRWPAADPERKLLWLVSGDKLLALDVAAGAVKHTATPVARPVGLAVRNGRLAVSSAATRQVHVFDCTDPANLKSVATLGREWKPGASGLGPIDPARLDGAGPVALSSRGDVATVVGNIRFFKNDGTPARSDVAFWGQHTPSGMLTGPDGKLALHFSGMGSATTVALDTDAGTWRPGYRLQFPPGLAGPGALVCFFTEGGKNFGAFSVGGDNGDRSSFAIVRFDDYVGKTVARFQFDGKANAMVMLSGTEGALDRGQPLRAPDGKPVAGLRFLQDGRLLAGGCVIPRKGLDGAGVPVWDWSRYMPGKLGVLEAGGQGNVNGDFLDDGGWVTGGTEGKPRGFGGGFNAFKALGPTGEPRWTFPIDYHCTTGGFKSTRVLPGVVLATAVEELDTVFVDHDGLGLGVVGPIPGLKWEGYWHDQDWSLRAFVNKRGQRFVVLGDYTRHGYHWMEVKGVDEVRHSRVAVTLDGPTAQALAAAAAPAAVESPRPPTPGVLVRKLAKPLKVDGDLKKWRERGVTPQIVVSPPGISPLDCSALIRTAWEGDNLYFQVIKFDNVVTMHQPLQAHYKQDSTELALVGGFMGGYKFAITRTTDKGDVVFREQFLMKKDLLLDSVRAPRVIKVLENAKDVEERKLIEDSYGVDLSGSKVIVTEFMIPMSYAWDGKAPVAMKSGTGFWMGWYIDDNDTPGLDEQRAYPWPVTFAAFGNADQGAWATLE